MKLSHLALAFIATLLSIGISIFGISTGQSSTNAGVQISPTNKTWHGTPPTNVKTAIDRLAVLTEEHPSLFGGAAYTQDRQRVNLYIAQDDALTQVPDARSYVDQNASIVNIVKVSRSLTKLKQLQNLAVAKFSHNGLASAAISYSNNSVRLVVKRNSAAHDQTLWSAKSRAASDTGFSIAYTDGISNDAGRYHDYERFYMGGAIVSEETRCSLGVPMFVDGVKGVITAGHCTGKTFHTPGGRYVGKLYATAYPKNADKYGDWQLLFDATYAPNIFIGPPGSSAKTNVQIISESHLREGQAACSSSITTGQLCDYIVTSTNGVMVTDGVTHNYVATMIHDSNNDGIGDCGGWNKGDSGGPIYSHLPHAKATVYGIITSHATSSPQCRYYLTLLDGVRAWRSDAHVTF